MRINQRLPSRYFSLMGICNGTVSETGFSALQGERVNYKCQLVQLLNPFTADPVKALHFAILV